MNNNIIKDYKSGKSIKYLTKKYNKSNQTIENLLINNKILLKEKIKIKNELEIKELLEKNYSSSYIKNKIKTTNISINKICYKYDLNKPYHKTNNKYEYNEEIFEVIDTEEKAYWLGFLYADGSNHYDKNIVLSLKEDDIEHIKKFTNFCIKKNGENKIDYNKKTKSKRIIISCKKITLDLIDKGIIRNKSFKIKFQNFDKINKEFTKAFIRGYFDGDGSLHIHQNFSAKAEFIGNKEFLISLNDYLKKELNIDEELYLYKKKNTEIYSLSLKKRKYAKIFLDYIYKNSNIYLERKYNKFLCTEKWRPGVKTKIITG